MIVDHIDGKVENLDREVRACAWDVQEVATTYILLERDNQGLREIVGNEKKKRKRGVPLVQQLAANEDGRAVFHSPNKVRQAQELLQEKEDAKNRDEASKAENKLQRQLDHEEKDRITEENKTKRALAKSEREHAQT
jgi:hypothetical protein